MVCIFFSALSFGGFCTFAEVSDNGDYEYTVKSDGTVKITSYNGHDFNVEIPETINGFEVTEIAYGAFSATSFCTKNYKYTDCIRRITVPKSVKVLNSAFKNLPFLKRIDVNKENPAYCSIDGVLFNKDKTVLICYPSSRMDMHYVIPSSVTTIDKSAFSGSVFLQSVKIGKNVKTIKRDAFLDCNSMQSIYIPKTVTKIGSHAVGVKTEYYSAFSDEFYEEDYMAPEDEGYAHDYEYFEGYYVKAPGFTVYGKVGSAAEKYCKKVTDNNGADFSVSFKTVNTSMPKVKATSSKRGHLKWSVNWYDGVYEYDYKIYKGKKVIEKGTLFASSEYVKNGKYVRSDFRLKKGVYTIKVKAHIMISGNKFKTPWSKRTKFTVE